MWWAEHAAMMASFAALAGFLAWRRNWIWLSAAALSQVPYWGGAAAFVASGAAAPVTVNVILNLMVAGCFASIAERLQERRRGGIVHIWLCFVFLIMCSMDVVQLLAPFDFYVAAQEAAHYVALLVIGGRAYVRRIDGNHRRNLHPSDTDKGKDLV